VGYTTANVNPKAKKGIENMDNSLKPFFSIIVPIYKVERYLDECIASVLSQSFADYECILVDDGSPDNCPAICDKYAEKYKHIKTIHKKNGGLSDARNTGIQAALGKYIVLLDSDDRLADDNTLENLFAVIEDAGTEVVVNVNWFLFNEQGIIESFTRYDKSIQLASPADIDDGFNKSGMYMAGCLFVVAVEYLVKYNLFYKEGILHEDEHWMPRVLFSTKKIAVNHSPFYAYRYKRKGSIMSAVTPQRLFDLISIVDDLFEWSKEEQKYGRDGCLFMLHRAEILWHSVWNNSENIKIQYKQEYRKVCTALRKRMKKISCYHLDESLLFFKIKLFLIVVLGVEKSDNLLKLLKKIKQKLQYILRI